MVTKNTIRYKAPNMIYGLAKTFTISCDINELPIKGQSCIIDSTKYTIGINNTAE
jgi:hypothetical protein